MRAGSGAADHMLLCPGRRSDARANDRRYRRSFLARQPLPGTPVGGVEELATPKSTLVLASGDFSRVKRAVVSQAPAVDDQRVPDVRIADIPDPLVVLRLDQEAHHRLI